MITPTGVHHPPAQGEGVTPAKGQEQFYPYSTSVMFSRASWGILAHIQVTRSTLKSGSSFKRESKGGEGVRRSLHRGHLEQPRLRTEAHL